MTETEAPQSAMLTDSQYDAEKQRLEDNERCRIARKNHKAYMLARTLML